MRYNFRLTFALKEKLNVVAPPRARQCSHFIRKAITNLLSKPKQNLVDRPHLRGRDPAYTQVCAILTQNQVDAIKIAYPDVSIAVVIQAAVSTELQKPQYIKNIFTEKNKSLLNASKQNTDANQSSSVATKKIEDDGN